MSSEDRCRRKCEEAGEVIVSDRGSSEYYMSKHDHSLAGSSYARLKMQLRCAVVKGSPRKRGRAREANLDVS